VAFEDGSPRAVHFHVIGSWHLIWVQSVPQMLQKWWWGSRCFSKLCWMSCPRCGSNQKVLKVTSCFSSCINPFNCVWNHIGQVETIPFIPEGKISAILNVKTLKINGPEVTRNRDTVSCSCLCGWRVVLAGMGGSLKGENERENKNKKLLQLASIQISKMAFWKKDGRN